MYYIYHKGFTINIYLLIFLQISERTILGTHATPELKLISTIETHGDYSYIPI